MMKKERVLTLIIEKLTEDLAILFQAAKIAHEASTDLENIPENKYDTLSLEASYVAQGQANRAQELKMELEFYKNLSLTNFDEHSTIYLTALVTLEAEDETQRTVFLGPQSGGLKVEDQGNEITVITLNSPLGKALIGKVLGDLVEIRVGSVKKEFEIVEAC